MEKQNQKQKQWHNDTGESSNSKPDPKTAYGRVKIGMT